VVEGRRISYLDAGPADGPVVIALHGLLSDATTWDRALAPLAARGVRVLAVDLPGHGESDKPPGLYLLDDLAIALDGFCAALDLDSVTICGHSFGGAVGIHFGHHYPHRVQRQVLVSAGGLGREVNLALRLLTARHADTVTAAVLDRRVVRRILRSPRLRSALRLRPEQIVNIRRIMRPLLDPRARSAFFASARGVIEPSGQRGNFLEMEYLASHLPTLLVWSTEDSVIPVAHAHRTHAALPGSRLVVFAGAGHEPHRRNADEFADAVAQFIAGPTSRIDASRPISLSENKILTNET
jgi:pimeloyl-ACP methyl ester carboxylesterase